MGHIFPTPHKESEPVTEG